MMHRLHRHHPTPLVLRRLYSSGSPITAPNAQEHFIKTGKHPSSDPMKISLRSEEYSLSGGDDMVSAQTSASYDRDADPASTKVKAGKGNAVNPLEASPATPELSSHFTETHVEKGVEKMEGTRTGRGVTRKSKRVERTELDFDTSKSKMKDKR